MKAAGGLLGLWLLATAASAELRLELEARRLTAAERAASQALLDEARQALPPTLIERLPRTVEVRWQELPAEVYGRAAGRRLLLNRAHLPALVDGSAATTATGRSHGTLRQELLATVLHEIAHLYDRARWLPPTLAAADWQCRQLAAQLGAVGLPGHCRQASARRFSLSDDPALLELAGWARRPGGRGAREHDNGHISRSPDDYELSSPLEFVAVNLEYFLLDPSYACRRPSLHRLLAEHFAWTPPAAPCPPHWPLVNAGQDVEQSPLLELDPARVWQVDYLFAEANQRPMSRWGHSMLRLVVCAPERAPGPDCRLDLQHHLVLSFRAFIDDLQLSSWSGLTGEYPSRLFILPLGQVIDEYTKVELRALSSVPLALERAQIEALVQRSVELHWGYDGRYYFLSRNCAVETLTLLRAALGGRWDGLDSILPNGLLELLVARGLADAAPLAEVGEARRLGYRFDSYRERYEAMFQVVRAQLPVTERSVEAWLDLPPEQRRVWIARADLRTSAALLLLEEAARHRQWQLIRDELKQRYLDQRQRGDELPVDATLRALLADSGYLSRPAELLGDDGYGIPQPAEWARLGQESARRQARLQDLVGSLETALEQQLLPAQQAALAAGETNLAQIRAHLRALHEAAGGLRLR